MKPEIRFNGFSDEWVEKKLGELFKKESIKNSHLEYGPSKIISLANLYYKNDLDNVPSDSYMKTYNEFKVGDIAFEGNKNKNYKYGRFVANTLGDGVISHVFEVYRPKVTFDTNYLGEFINYEPIMGRILRRTTKSTTMMTSLVSSDFLKESVGVPSLPEQQKIGALFSKYDAIITLREQKLEELNALKKGLLQQMFDDGHKSQVRFSGFNDEWVEKKLGEITERFDSNRKAVSATKRIKGDIPYYGAVGIQGYIDGYTHDGDYLLIAEDGASSMLDYPVRVTSGKIWVNNHAHVLAGLSNVADNKFLRNKLLTIDMTPYITGGSRHKLTAGDLETIKIQLPSLPEQQKIGQLFKQLDDRISNEQTKIEQLKAQKQGLLQRML